MKEKLNIKRVSLYVLAIVFISIYIISICKFELQNDTLFDIKLGEKYITQGIDTQDNFSIHEGLEYSSHHFMVNIITYLVYHGFGFIGLYVLEILLAGILAVLFYLANRIFIKSKKISYLLVFMELFLISPFVSVRAQMYSYLFFLLEIICIEMFLRKKDIRFLIGLSIIPLFIVNFHSGTVFFYFIILLVYLLNYFRIRIGKIQYDETINSRLKYLWIPMVVGACLLFVNPFGIQGILYSIKTLSNSFINSYIAEFSGATLSGETYMYVAFFSIMMVYILRRNQIKLHHILLVFGTMFMTLLSLRHFSLFIIVLVTNMGYIADGIRDFVQKMCQGILVEKIPNMKMIMMGGYILCFVALMASQNSHQDYIALPKDTYPIDAMRYIDENIPKDARIFNNYTWGSIMMMHDRKVFIDSRCDLYTKEYNEGVTVAFDYINANNCMDDYKEILTRYQIEYIFIEVESPLAKNIKNDPAYEKQYEDDLACIYRVVK